MHRKSHGETPGFTLHRIFPARTVDTRSFITSPENLTAQLVVKGKLVNRNPTSLWLMDVGGK